ncbi:hypothetical protein F511_25117 [Dorcoceras hygrometricum]|uniref:Uncharacterized protein n=1 Tax=Dorcoceras hygrometricum TaxID=472368 RepID=A0A2Z7BP16_9LAMI|nr:hypothetical protein F511_25117 [Dorcoceras hygrometricum]
MSLFDLRDACKVIGSLATLDSPMVVDLIGIYMLKGSYCTLTMTDWFLQALSVIPRGSWGDVTRRFTMIRLGYITLLLQNPRVAVHSSPSPTRPLPTFRRSPPCAAACRGWTCSDRLDEEIPFVKYSSRFLVQTDEGIEISVVDRIRRTTTVNR